MQTFYVSLVRDFIGYYLEVESDREIDVRLYMNKFYPRLWCSVYSEKFFKAEIKPKYKNIQIIKAANGFIPLQFTGDRVEDELNGTTFEHEKRMS